ncbi:MAG: hypothetical protein KIT31_31415 [Deltaproteobacteria bacterium]|nr:hypothetical protein [Deltaproteobacteria bacterium]
MHRLVVAAAALLLPTIAAADATVQVQLNDEGRAVAQQLGTSPERMAAQIKEQIDSIYQTGNVDGFLRAFTDATSFSARGIGVDYASAPTGFLVGIAANVAAAGNGDLRGEERPTAGLAANLAIMAGLNLKPWGLPKWTVFGNGFYRGGAAARLDGTITSAGAHVMYRIAEPTSTEGATGSAVRWLGLSLTTGIEYTRWQLGLGGDSIDTNLDVGEGSAATTLALAASGRFDLRSNAVTIPIEATTGLRIAVLASVYVGAGIDLTRGNSTVEANLNGTLLTSDNRDVGTVAITGNGDNTGSPGSARLIAGAQLNLANLKLFVQASASATPAASVAFGLRFVQ